MGRATENNSPWKSPNNNASVVFTIRKHNEFRDHLPRLCKFYYNADPCVRCETECPLDVAIRAIRENTKSIHGGS